MALDITAQDLIIDETPGDQDDDSTVSNSTVTYLLSLDDPGGLNPPEVAYQQNFVVASASAGEVISGVTLSQNIGGTAFSTSVGVNSGIRTADGNYVWLFKDADPAHANVVIGVIGTSNAATMPAATGDLAFSMALVGTDATHYDLYTVEYVPLLHPDGSNSDDRIDLTNKVYASVAGTTTVGFSGANAASGNPDFYIINSPTDATKQILVIGQAGGTANVSTQGFGIANQSINPTETLQVDFVTGGTLASGSASQIAYTSHIETISQAGFTINQITPSAPNNRVDVIITALNATGNQQGTDFYDGTPASAVDITSVKLTSVAGTGSGFASIITADGTYATASGNVTITGLTGNGNAVTITGIDNVTVVDFTTATPMDRLLVTGVDAVEGCDITEFHFTTTTPNAYTEEVGSFINFDDDGPTISTTGTEPELSVDETVLATDDTKSFAANFSSGYGSDGAGTLTYALSVVAGPSGLVDTATNQAVNLSLNGGVVEGRTATSNELVFTVSVDSSGNVTLNQLRAVVHANANDSNDSATLSADNLVKLTATITDKDGDDEAATLNIGRNLTFLDDGPSISTTGTEPELSVDETVLTTDDTKSFAANFTSAYGADGAGTLTYALSVVAGASGLVDTVTGQAVNLSVTAGGVVEGRTATSNDLVFTVSVNSSGSVTLDQKRAVVHSDATNANDSATLSADNLVKLTATVTDKDGDDETATLDIGRNLTFLDDGPTLTAAFDADPATMGIQTPEQLLNVANQTASGIFGYDIGADQRSAAFYSGGGSDFVDDDLVTAGVQITLTGTVDNASNPNITQAVATRTAETASSATFTFSFHYDKDPDTAGVQDATAGGTLVFDKANDTYQFTLTDVIDGFAFDVLHTNELIAKAPIGNTGHPLIVASQLTPNGDPDPFFVQFTGNSTTQQIGFGFNSDGDGAPVGDTTFNNGGATHDLITNVNEDWVSATQATNGVAGDTIQKGECLSLRFFDFNILPDVNPQGPGGGNERLVETATTSGVIIKFDGIGNSEDLVLILDLIDANGNEITRAVNVQNSDLIKGNANVPAPYNAEFTLDNNDALLIIEANDYNVAGGTYQIQGVQIMQSANGLTGQAINLNGAVGTNGGSSATSNLTAWDPTDNDVLKIVDIGFVQQTSGLISANLDFAFNIADGDGDLLGVKHITVAIDDSFV